MDMQTTIIQRRKIAPNQQWEDITLEQAVDVLESTGYWKKGTTSEMLLNGEELWMPTAQYKLKKYE